MISKWLTAAGFALTVAGTGAIAAQSDDQAAVETGSATTAAQASAGTDAAQDERKICHTDKVTGSLSRRNRVCLTAAQWREVQDRTRRGVDEMNNAASGGKECVQDERGGCR